MDQSLANLNGTSELVNQAHYGYNKVSALEGFLKKLNTAPPTEELKQTPDKKAQILPISFVETKLDEIYLGQWGASELHIHQVGNEIIGNLILWVIHPITGLKIERPGTAAIQITMDAVPKRIKFQSGDSEEESERKSKERNAWALDLQNKKPNGLSLAAPKLRAESIKNAAKSLGKIFGRDLNREHTDEYESIYSDEIQVEFVRDELEAKLEDCATFKRLGEIWEEYTPYHSNPSFKRVFASYKAKLSYKQPK